MKYRISEHCRYRLRKPKRIRKTITADERKDRKQSLTVNVLIMAKSKNKKNRVTAGDLFGKLGRTGNSKSAHGQDDEFIEEPLDELDEDAIDVTSDEGDSDSDLDINALLKKYMPDYQDDEPAADEGGSVLSKFRKKEDRQEDLTEDEKLIDALDDAFGAEELFAEEFSDDAADGQVDSDEELDFSGLMSSLKKTASSESGEETISEYDLAEEDSFNEAEEEPEFTEEFVGEEFSADEFAEEESLETDPAADDFEEPDGEEDLTADAPDLPEDFVAEKPKKKGLFGSLFGSRGERKESSRKKASVDDFADELEEQEREMGGTDSVEDDLAVPDPDTLDAVAEERAAAELVQEKLDDLLTEEPVEGFVPAEAVAEFDSADEEIPDGVEDTPETDGEYAADGEESANEAEEEIDPTDINLMVAFGMDKKSDKAKQFGDRLEEKQNTKAKKLQLDRPEYVDKTQTPQIRAEYKAKQTSLWVRLVLCGILSAILLIFENIEPLTKLFTGTGKQFAGVMDPAVYPVVYIMISLQIMLLACFCAYDQILSGIKSLFRGSPKPETMTALMTLLGIVYSILMARLIEIPEEPVMFNFIVALSAFLTLIYAIYNNRREMLNFRIVANKRPKHIVRRLQDEESECESKAFADNDDVCDVMKIEKTDFIDGFFGRLSKPDPSTGRFMVFAMSASVAIAVLFGVFTSFYDVTPAQVCMASFGSMMILTPLSVYITFSYPFFRANLAAKEYDSAIIGEASLDEYSNASIISFDDKNVFPSYSVKVQNIKIFNNARIDRMLYYASSVFAYAGGPLQDVFEIATKDMGNSDNVKIFGAESGFLAAEVDGVNIIFGSHKALSSRGMEFPDNATEDDIDLSDELEIMYMFREDKLVLKFYVKYVMDADIDLILKQFSGSGLYVCVRTFDPNIDERMIAKKLNMKRMPLKIVRYASTEEVSTYEEKVDSGLVTCGSPKSLLQVISYCGKVLHTKKTNIALSVLSVMIGTAILVLLLLSQSMGTLNSLFVAIYQLIWLIPMTISSRMFIR